MTRAHKIGLAWIQGGSILLCKPFEYDDLVIPGGVLGANETALENLRRKLKEELGGDALLDEASLQHIGNFEDLAAGRKDRIVEIELYLGQVHGKVAPSSGIRELVWFNPSSPGSHKLSAIVERKILPHLRAAKLI